MVVVEVVERNFPQNFQKLYFVAVVLDHVQLLVRCCRRIGFQFRKSQGDFATDLSTGLPYLAEVLSLFEDSR